VHADRVRTVPADAPPELEESLIEALGFGQIDVPLLEKLV